MSLKVAVVRKYLQAYNQFDIDGMVGCLTDDVVFENYNDGQLTVSTHGADQFRGLAESSRRLFRSRELEIVAVDVSNESEFRAQVRFKAVMALDIENGPRAGEVVRASGRAGYTFRGALICRLIDEA